MIIYNMSCVLLKLSIPIYEAWGLRPVNFDLLEVRQYVGKRARVQFHSVSLQFGRGFNLIGLRFDEHADADPRGVKAFNRLFERFKMLGHVQPTFGRYLLPIFWN